MRPQVFALCVSVMPEMRPQVYTLWSSVMPQAKIKKVIDVRQCPILDSETARRFGFSCQCRILRNIHIRVSFARAAPSLRRCLQYRWWSGMYCKILPSNCPEVKAKLRLTSYLRCNHVQLQCLDLFTQKSDLNSVHLLSTNQFTWYVPKESSWQKSVSWVHKHINSHAPCNWTPVHSSNKNPYTTNITPVHP